MKFFESIFDFIERFKFAIIGTVLFHVCFFLYANFQTIHRPYTLVEPPAEMNVSLEDIPLDPEVMKILNIPQDNGQSQEVTNVVGDANDTREKSYDDFSTQEIDKQVQANAEALEKQYFDEWAGTHGDKQAPDKSSMDLDDKTNDKKNQNTNPDNTIDSDGNKAFAGDVMASFDLKDRKAHSLAKPGYTCNTSGTVMLQIKVDKNGDITDVSYLAAGSSNATECMINQSIKYAKRSRFNYSATAPATQTGTITYKFVSK